MKTIIILFLFLLAFPALRAQEEAITLKTPTGDIFGTLTIPEQKTNIPVVIIIPGSGPTDRDGNNPMMKNNMLKMLAESLQKNDIASLRFDKRGIAQSKDALKSENDIRFEDYVNDLKMWIDLIKKDKRFNQIIVTGHSEGALIGMLACIDNPIVNKYISLSGAGESLSDILREQLSQQPQQIKDIAIPILDKLAKGDTVGNVSPFLYSLFRPDVQPYLISCFRYDPAKEISKLSIPILLIQGTTDIQVHVKDADLLAKANPKAQKHIIQDVNHLLKDCTAPDMASQMAIYTNPELPLNTEVVQYIIDFIKQ